MSATAVPIPLDVFVVAIQSLDLPLLHREIARLQNSIFHLQRTNVALELEDDAEIGEIVSENRVVIVRQEERITALQEEIVRRTGRGDVCGAGVKENGAEEDGESAEGGATNGVVNGGGNGTVELEVREHGGSGDVEQSRPSAASVASPGTATSTQARSDAPSDANAASQAPAEEEGVYL